MSNDFVKRSNIASLAYRNVLQPMVSAGDPVSWILFVAFLALLAVSVTLKVAGGGDPDTLYERGFLAFWYGAWGLLVLSTIGPMFTIAKQRNEIPLGILVGVGVCHLVTFIAISVVVLLQYNKPEAVTGLMAAFVAAMMVGIGWVVQHQTGARASRRAHTFNILMQSRLNKEFQENCALRATYYHSGKSIPSEDADLATSRGLSIREGRIESDRARELGLAQPQFEAEVNARYDEELALCRKKHQSLIGVVYLLNFYEFMCAGICQRELDKHLLYATVATIVSSLYEDTRHLRAYCREGQPSVFIKLDEVMQHHWHS
jgi:hypothetical protein